MGWAGKVKGMGGGTGPFHETRDWEREGRLKVLRVLTTRVQGKFWSETPNKTGRHVGSSGGCG